ncbi:MAG: T9SS type A sorting domain-containing protein, partial [Saprospiraceae bacterium]|nr:T9SS type A sorting domain-containing protein [Saprospiraceae bacterium]
DEEVSILIFDINGQIVRKVQFEKIADLRQTIDIDQIPAGTYFVNVRTNLQQKTLKLIKQ